MEFRKSAIVNGLFIASFPVYGIGKYVAQVGNFSFGQILSVLPLLLICLLYIVDLLLHKDFTWRMNSLYIWTLVFTCLCMVSFYMALANGYPGSNPANTFTLSLVALVMVHGVLAVQLYNTYNPSFSIAKLLYAGLTIDIAVNLVGYAAGLRNPIHSIEGRLNLPFGQGFYSTANTVAIVNLLILAKWLFLKPGANEKILLALQFALNGFLMVSFNSRLSILIFLLVCLLMVSKLMLRHRLVYWASLFTLPALLSFADLIYQVLQWGPLQQVLQRVSYKDVTGFNGRRDLWERGLHWIYTQGEGFLFGNGYHGYYTIGLINDLEAFWFRSAVNLHMHSSVLEYALSIGAVGVVALMLVLYKTLGAVRRRIDLAHPDQILLGALVYLLFVFQIDNYVYIINFGSLIVLTIISIAVVDKKQAI